MALIDCKNVTMSYDGKAVLSNLSFSINAGDYLCIVGENGSGKSTLVKGLLGLINPSKGSFEFSEGLKQREIGYLPQRSGIQKDFPASVYEVVLSGRLNSRGLHPFYSKKDKLCAMDNIEKLAIKEIYKKSFMELSGGQQQRVLLARALCATKKLLLLDEPVTGLDPIVCSDMYKIIHRLNKEDGITIVMVSHDIVAAADNANHILHLSESESFFGKTETYMHSELGSKFLYHNCHCELCNRNNKNHHTH